MHRLCREHAFPPRRPNAKPNLHGWLGDGNQLLLKKFIRKETKLIFEFGTWLGKSAMFMLNLQADNPAFTKVVCVDTWEGDWSIKQTDKYKEHLANLYDTFIVNMWDVRERVVPVRMDGRKAMKYLHSLGLKPDLIYLDMDHSYESAKGDLECLMKYFPDTLILGDDVLYWKGVAKAVKEIVKEHNITNLEINKNCYALVPSQCSKRYRLKELVTKVIQPKEQYIDYKIGIIVGFHPRSHTRRQLHRFREHMTSFMEQTGVDFKIYVIEQHDQQQELNLGHLYNSGYEIALADGCEKFVFQDIYLLPSKALMPYYRRHNKYPIHLGYHYDKYFYEVYYLGIIMFNKENFELVNGYPINIYGLYGWDYEMVLRIKDAGLKLKLPAEGSVIPNGTHPRINVQEWRKIKTSAIINKHSETWKSNGLKNTFYVRQPNRNHTVKNTQCFSLCRVSFVDYSFFLVNQQDICYRFMEDGLCIDDLQFAKNTTNKRDTQYGFIKDDKRLKETFCKEVDTETVNTLFTYEYLTLNQCGYNNVWTRKQGRKSYTMKSGVVRHYDVYKLNVLLHITNSFAHMQKRDQFDVYHLCPLPVNVDINESFVSQEVQRIQNNVLFWMNHKLNSRAHVSITNQFMYCKNVILTPCVRCRVYDRQFMNNDSFDVHMFERLISKSDQYELCILSMVLPINTSHSNDSIIITDFFIQSTIGCIITKKHGTCVLKTFVSYLCAQTVFMTLCTLRTYFERVTLVFSCIQNGRQAVVFVVCDNFRGLKNTDKNRMISLAKQVLKQPMCVISCTKQEKLSRLSTSYWDYLQKLQVQCYDNISKQISYTRCAEKEQDQLRRKIHQYKLQRSNQFIQVHKLKI